MGEESSFPSNDRVCVFTACCAENNNSVTLYFSPTIVAQDEKVIDLILNLLRLPYNVHFLSAAIIMLKTDRQTEALLLSKLVYIIYRYIITFTFVVLGVVVYTKIVLLCTKTQICWYNRYFITIPTNTGIRVRTFL